MSWMAWAISQEMSSVTPTMQVLSLQTQIRKGESEGRRTKGQTDKEERAWVKINIRYIYRLLDRYIDIGLELDPISCNYLKL
jgi:hypothetical protein